MRSIINRRKLIIAAAVFAPAIIKSRADDLPLLGVSSKVGASFNPLSLITGAGGFWRADTGVSHSGANVSSWADQSSFAQNMTATSNPQYSSTGWLSSYPGITLNGSSNYFSNSSFSFSPSSTASGFMLLSFANEGPQDGIICFMAAGDSGSDWNSTHGVALTTQNSSPGLQLNQDSGSIAQVSAGMSNSTPYLIGFVEDGTNLTLFVNALSSGGGFTFSGNPKADTNEIGGTGSSCLALGARVTSLAPSSNYCDATIAFAGFTQRALTGTDWTNLKNWSNANWGTSF